MTAPLAYVNGRFVPFDKLTISVADAGFVFGATVTDLVRTFRGRSFRVADHIDRFRESCRLCHVPLTASDDDLRGAAEHLIWYNLRRPPETGIPVQDEHGRVLGRFLPQPVQDAGELALVMFATPGPIGYYAGLPVGPGDGPPTVGMHTFPLPLTRYRKLFTEGATLVVPPTQHVAAASVDPRAKMRSRLFWWIAEQETKEIDPGASALLLNAAGHVTETATANFLIVRDGTVLSPPRGTILGGISLRVVEELCGELGIPFAEAPMTLAECMTADEALLTGTAFCVAGVGRLNGTALPWPGPVWRRLLAAWSDRVGVDIEGQIKEGTV